MNPMMDVTKITRDFFGLSFGHWSMKDVVTVSTSPNCKNRKMLWFAYKSLTKKFRRWKLSVPPPRFHFLNGKRPSWHIPQNRVPMLSTSERREWPTMVTPATWSQHTDTQQKLSQRLEKNVAVGRCHDHSGTKRFSKESPWKRVQVGTVGFLGDSHTIRKVLTKKMHTIFGNLANRLAFLVCQVSKEREDHESSKKGRQTVAKRYNQWISAKEKCLGQELKQSWMKQDQGSRQPPPTSVPPSGKACKLFKHSNKKWSPNCLTNCLCATQNIAQHTAPLRKCQKNTAIPSISYRTKLKEKSCSQNT